MALNYKNMQRFVRNVIHPYIVNLRDVVNSAIDSHSKRTDNPHNVKMSQVATISSLAPTSVQGENGDVWIEYLNT